ncbi:MAG: PrgI family protein [Candidatus Peribacteraceae bacterium]|nr:PrgI family protein [Candidatus Peribacteraceae bacterium]
MAIEPVKIPQNVYVEDRIIGPITLRQLVIVLLSGGLSYAIWGSMKTAMGYVSIPATVVAWIPCAIGVAFAFIKIQGISLTRFLLLMIEKTDKPPVRVWTPRRGISVNFRYFTTGEKEKSHVAPTLQPHHEKLVELSAFLDRGPISAIARKENGDQKKEADDFAALMEDAQPEETAPPPRPVDPDRVRTSPRPAPERPMEDIAAERKTDAPSAHTPASTLIHDILPPSS